MDTTIESYVKRNAYSYIRFSSAAQGVHFLSSLRDLILLLWTDSPAINGWAIIKGAHFQ